MKNFSLFIFTALFSLSAFSQGVGINTTTPQSMLDVEGNVAIGQNYSGSTAAPVDGMIVEGNVGIGTSSPGVKLHVFQSGAAVNVRIEGDGTGLQWKDASGAANDKYVQAFIASTTGIWQMRSLNDDLTERQVGVTMDMGSGDFGVGTSAPSQRLHIYNATTPTILLEAADASNAALTLKNSGQTWNIFNNSTGIFKISESGNQAFQIEPSTPSNTLYLQGTTGNVGIGTSAPAVELHVTGTSAAQVAQVIDNLDTGAGSYVILSLRGTGTSGTTNGMGRILAGKDQQWTSTASTRDGYLTLETREDNTMTERVRVSSSGNVGIGTSVPTGNLHVQTANTGATTIQLENTDTGGRKWGINTTGSTGNGGAGMFKIVDVTSATDRFAIDTDGNVGIGTLTMDDENSISGKLVVDAGANFGNLFVGGTRSTAGNGVGGIGFIGENSASERIQYSKISGIINDATDGTEDGEIAFYTESAGTLTEHMRLDEVGNLGIGTTAPTALLDIEATGDGTRLLELSTERAWAFEQENTGASSELRLRNITGGNKTFNIDTDGRTEWRSQDGTSTLITVDHGSGELGIGISAPDSKLHMDGAITLEEQTATPSDPDNGSQARMYVKGDKLIIQYNDAGTVRYKYLDLTGTTITWTHTTTAP